MTPGEKLATIAEALLGYSAPSTVASGHTVTLRPYIHLPWSEETESELLAVGGKEYVLESGSRVIEVRFGGVDFTTVDQRGRVDAVDAVDALDAHLAMHGGGS